MFAIKKSSPPPFMKLWGLWWSRGALDDLDQSTDFRDSGNSLAVRKNDKYAKVISSNSSSKKQEVAKVCYNKLGFFFFLLFLYFLPAALQLIYKTIFIYLQEHRFLIQLLQIFPFKGCIFGYHINHWTAARYPSSCLPSLPHLLQHNPALHFNQQWMMNMIK